MLWHGMVWHIIALYTVVVYIVTVIVPSMLSMAAFCHPWNPHAPLAKCNPTFGQEVEKWHNCMLSYTN